MCPWLIDSKGMFLTRGTVRKRGKKWAVITDVPRLGSEPRRQKWFSGYATKKDAERDLSRIMAEMFGGTFVEPSAMTLCEYLRHWLEAYASINVSAKTLERYREIIERAIIPALGHVKLTAVAPAAIQTFYSRQMAAGGMRGGKLSARTVLHYHRILHEALRHAVKWQMLSRNPTESVEPPRPKAVVIKPLDESGCDSLMRAVRGTGYELPVFLAIWTGMRRGEILALRWSDVDFERRVAMVTRTLQQTGEGLSFKEPKSAKSRRQIALSPETVTMLKSHKAIQARRRLLLGEGYADLDLICARGDGSPIKPDGFTASFKGFVSRRGMKTLHFHDLRHTHASLLLKGNIHPKIVSERLGHATIGITLDTYSHLMPGMQEEAARSIDSALSAVSGR
jgi:integrase